YPSKTPREFGYVEFYERRDAERAFDEARDLVINGQSLRVEFAKGRRKWAAGTTVEVVALATEAGAASGLYAMEGGPGPLTRPLLVEIAIAIAAKA
ncbi:hypothetical protein EV182_005764, partial [Spiromyces aspiralis]